MSGNVMEWCQDWHSSKYYKNSPKHNPQGSKTGDYRVLRGGSWLISPYFLRVADRNSGIPEFGDFNIGFRLSRSV